MKSLENSLNIIQQELHESALTLQRFMNDEEKLKAVEEAAQLIVAAIENGNKVISCGNGGSHCDAMHFAEELSGRYREGRRALPAIAISDPSHITCTGNDFGFDHIFSRFIEGLGNPGDILLGISTSGNSANIIKAVEAAKAKDMKVIILTGNDGGKLCGVADVEIRVEHQGYADRIQEIHIKVIHIMMLLIEKSIE